MKEKNNNRLYEWIFLNNNGSDIFIQNSKYRKQETTDAQNNIHDATIQSESKHTPDTCEQARRRDFFLGGGVRDFQKWKFFAKIFNKVDRKKVDFTPSKVEFLDNFWRFQWRKWIMFF